jgi:predicted negative regulator of RcsB-dependent stress response
VQATDARITRQRLDRRSRLLAQLGDTSVQSAYAEADRAHSATELEQARERLTALSSAGLGGTSTAVEAEQLRPDVYCRLAEITLRLGQARAALDWARQGLELGSEPSPFVACLYQQQGRAREALGDRDGAARSYMNALQVNERLLDESLEGP